MKIRTHPVRAPLWRCVLAAAVLAAGGGAAASLAAPADGQPSGAASPVLTMWPVPAGMLPSGSGAIIDSALAPAADGAGQEVIASSSSGGATAFEVTPAGQFRTSSTPGQLGAGPFVAMVSADSLDWALSADGLYAIGGSGSAPQQFPVPSGSFTDMALGVDGHLYLAVGSGSVERCEISSSPSSSCTTAYPIGSAFSSPQPEALASAGTQLWFTTGAAEIGWVSPAGTQGGPYNETTDNNGNSVGPASSLPHSLALGANGYLFAIGSPTDPTTGITSPNSTILEIDARVGPRVRSTGHIVDSYNLGLPAGTTISSLTSGPDGDIWFTEVTPSGPNAVGQLDPTTGTVTNYALPSGYALQGTGGEAIEPGPVGSYTVWFAAETTGSPNQPAIGEIANVGATAPAPGTSTETVSTTASTQIPTTTAAASSTTTATATTSTAAASPAHLSLAATAKIFRQRLASIDLRCAGASGQVCAGTVALAAVEPRTVTVKTHGHRRRRRRRAVLPLGSAPYRVRAGGYVTLAVKVSPRGLALLDAAPGHRLVVSAVATPALGTGTSGSLTLVGQANRRR